jgi:hypothetical protein
LGVSKQACEQVRRERNRQRALTAGQPALSLQSSRLS